ncbi:hypothetical protein BDK51DRAFT_34167 [Blyttiomyces helicus]|uniref:Uncharacterized protein n=1 Tax=Blyttiomyces helicus TaxID=388810 RepID=A0A4P9WDD8_9FUNG|nr:hypothetical protein BDK51DRAFT_34167 [Blyttiomyces helicus]|eukprot:RKO90554.1 hypothetical protein BDK51DRAFT_34167 [Blyttiomyces helicus]
MSIVVGLIGVAFVWCLGQMNWGTVDGRVDSNAFMIIATMTFVTSLQGFTNAQFIATYGLPNWLNSKMPTLFISSSVTITAIMQVLAVGFWYYQLDVGIILGAFLPGAFLAGYCTPSLAQESRYRRIMEGVILTLQDAFVASLAIGYGLFLMPIYMQLSAILQMLCRGRRSMEKEVDYRDQGSVMMHDLTLKFFFGRFLWRTTTTWRSSRMERTVGYCFKVPQSKYLEKLAIMRELAAIEIQTEMFLENTATIIGASLAAIFYPYRNFFTFNIPPDANVVTVSFRLSSACLQIALAILFDTATLLLNQRHGARLPFVKAWRGLWNIRWQFFPFMAVPSNIFGYGVPTTIFSLFSPDDGSHASAMGYGPSTTFLLLLRPIRFLQLQVCICFLRDFEERFFTA